MSGRVGYRFHPTDEELVDYFLKHKMNGHDSLVDEDIRFIDLCKFDPWDLPRYSAVVSNDQLWYFFCRREVKYKNTTRQCFNRSTQSGHWKPTGNERSIMSRSTNTEIGTKRTLVFYKRGTPKEVRTNWVIHEYQPKTLLHHQLIQTDFVLCKLKEKRLDKARISACDEGQSSRSGPSDNRPIEIPISQDDSERLLESLLASTCGGPNFNPVSPMQPQMHIDQGISIEDLISTDDYPVSLMQPQMHIDQVFSIEDLISTDDYGNDSDRLWEMEEDPNEMADSFIVVPDEHSGEEYLYPISGNPYGHNSEEGARINRNHSSSPNSMNGVYLDEIRDMDFYETPLQSGASNLNNGHYRQMQRVQAITETLPPSTFDQSGREKTGVLQMNISSSSADSDIDSFEDISVRVVSKKLPVHTRTHKQLQPSCGNIKAEKGATPKGSLIQGKLSGASEHKVKEPRKHVGGLLQPQENHKESITVKTEQDQTTDFAKTKLRENAVATYNKTGSFIRLETSVLSQSSSPPSVYFINVLIGLVLFLAAIREVLILH